MLTYRDIIFFIVVGLWFICGIVGIFCSGFGITWAETFLFFSGLIFIFILLGIVLLGHRFKKISDWLDKEI